MNHLSLLIAVGAVAAGATAGTIFLLDERGDAGAPSTSPEREWSALGDRLDELQRRQSALETELAGARLGPASAGLEREPALEAWVADAVARYLSERGAAVVAAADAGAPAAADFDLTGSLTALLTGTLPEERRDEVWAQARAAGRFEELLAALKARADADPRNAQLQFELGYGYLQPLIHGEATGVEAGEWSMKADAAFDAALAADPENWDARFSKAVSYSFWPPIFGKQASAIAHFERLVEQQGRSAPDPKFAQTYLFLGNMYEQTGQAEKAQATWQQGLAAYPDDADLRQRLGGN
jgi:tetratricopeptide (TPR) repeat protein